MNLPTDIPLEAMPHSLQNHITHAERLDARIKAQQIELGAYEVEIEAEVAKFATLYRIARVTTEK